jgi:SAM-dependent methyltransferase
VARAIDNRGERLVPGESHNREEAIRHKSSYLFFAAIIRADGAGAPLRILDLGCGVGHGSETLAAIDGAEVVGIDADADAIAYAREHYAAPNVSYALARADEYLQIAEPFDYVVSRHVLEHIPDGLQLALRFPRRLRLMVNVPYREPAHDAAHHVTNPHHELDDISEADFAGYPNAEFFFEDLAGVTRTVAEGANSIICVASEPGLGPVSSLVSLPFPAWKPNRLEEIALDSIQERASLRKWRPVYDALARAYAGARRATRRFARAGG